MDLILPMAGKGSRFAQQGYEMPKPLIDVNGKPMVYRVLENLLPIRFDNVIILALKQHLQDYGSAITQSVEDAISSLSPKTSYKIVSVPEVTGGAACTVLMAEKYLPDDLESVIVANADQLVYFSVENFRTLRTSGLCSGIIFCFYHHDSRWSFIRTNDNVVTEVAEKKRISNVATCGIYYFSYIGEMFRSIRRMIKNKDTVNGEFYLAPCYNYLMKDSLDPVLPFFVNKMIGLGTPEDLEAYLKQERIDG